jgi:hypothetical protein
MSNPFDKFDDPPKDAPAKRGAAQVNEKANPFDQFDPKPSSSTGTYIKGLARTAVQGATLGWGDEIIARGRSVLPEAVGGAEYKQAVAEERDALDQFKKENPKAAFVTELAGGLAMPGGAALSAAARATTMGGKMYRSAVVGGGMGGVHGAGKNENPDDLAGDVGKGVAIGAGVGAAAPVVGAVAGNLIDRFRPQARADTRLAQGIENSAEASGVTAAQEFARLRGAAAPQNAHRTNETLGTQLGPEAQYAVKEVGHMSPAVNAEIAAQGRAIRGVDLDPAYQAVYAGAPLTGNSAQSLMSLISSRPSFQAAAREARSDMVDLTGRAGVTLVAGNPAGTRFSPQFIDIMDRKLVDGVADAVKSGRGTDIAKAQDIQEQFRGMVQQHFPDLFALKATAADGGRMTRSLEAMQPNMRAPHTGSGQGFDATLAATSGLCGGAHAEAIRRPN